MLWLVAFVIVCAIASVAHGSLWWRARTVFGERHLFSIEGIETPIHDFKTVNAKEFVEHVAKLNLSWQVYFENTVTAKGLFESLEHRLQESTVKAFGVTVPDFIELYDYYTGFGYKIERQPLRVQLT